MRELFTTYDPQLLMTLISIYLVILVLAMIRYGLEKTWFIEHLFYTIGIFIITGCLGLQVGAQVMQKTNDLYISGESYAIIWGVCLLIYSFMLTLVFIFRCLITSTNYVRFDKKAGIIEILSSRLWGSVYGTYLWGIIFAWIGLATFLIIKGKPDNPNFSRLLGIIWLIAFFTIPFIVVKNYTKWIQRLINLGPIKRRIVKVQTAQENIGSNSIDKLNEK